MIINEFQISIDTLEDLKKAKNSYDSVFQQKIFNHKK